MEAAIADKMVTYDFARLMEGANGSEVLGLRPGDDRTHVSPATAKEAPNKKPGSGGLFISAPEKSALSNQYHHLAWSDFRRSQKSALARRH